MIILQIANLVEEKRHKSDWVWLKGKGKKRTRDRKHRQLHEQFCSTGEKRNAIVTDTVNGDRIPFYMRRNYSIVCAFREENYNEARDRGEKFCSDVPAEARRDGI